LKEDEQEKRESKAKDYFNQYLSIGNVFKLGLE
jgi:hypothetical protein